MRVVRVGDFALGPEEKAAVVEVLESGRISEGPRVAQFEQEWARFIGTKYCVATSSGFGALVVGLAAAKHVKARTTAQKVITSPLTYIADASAISAAGLTPVFVDIEPENFCLSPDALREYLSTVPDPENYLAVIPVDLMGYSCRIDRLRQVADEFGLILFEDPAEAHGTVYQGYRAGSTADLAAFSFYIAHNIQAGEMGAVVTNDPKLWELSRRLKAQGRACRCRVCTRSQGICPQANGRDENEDFDPRFSHDLIGYNFKTMEFQAALALVQLVRAEEIIAKRLHNVRVLNEGLAAFTDLLQLPPYHEEVSYLAYPLIIRNPAIISRKQLRLELGALGVETRPLFGCIPTQQPAYAHLKEEYEGRLPVAEYAGRHGFYIGCHQYLDDEALAFVIEAFHKVLDGRH